MIAIVCLDEQNGMLFNHRRQSKDRLVIEDILKTCEEKKLYMNKYSFAMFEELNVKQLKVADCFLEQSSQGEYCFIEDQKLSAYKDKIEQLIIYKWNRKYPADFYLDITIEPNWQKIAVKEFKGFSHDKITKETYIRA